MPVRSIRSGMELEPKPILPEMFGVTAKEMALAFPPSHDINTEVGYWLWRLRKSDDDGIAEFDRVIHHMRNYCEENNQRMRDVFDLSDIAISKRRAELLNEIEEWKKQFNQALGDASGPF